MKLLCLFLLILTYRFFDNLFKLKKVKSFSERYEQYVKDLAQDKSPDGNLRKQQASIKQLIQAAGIKDKHVNVSKRIASFIRISSASTIDNMFVNNVEIVSHMFSILEETEGVYESRLKENFNPLFWINTFLFLPKSVVSYLGISPDSITTKILQLIWWILSVIYTIYSDQLNPIIQDFLSNFVK